MLFRCWFVIHSAVFFFKQKTAYEMRISDWSSDVCSSDLFHVEGDARAARFRSRPVETLKEYNMLGRQVPDVVLKTRVRDESIGGDNPFRWQDMRTGDLFRNKRVVVFSLPGAFTPTCTTEQCPAFERFYEDFKAAGVDEVYCVSVNDAFVMYQWGKHLGIKNRSEEH